MTTLYPLTFAPVLKDYIWGGRNLATKLGRALPEHKEIAESWEIAAHNDGTTAVDNGPLAGTLLTDLVTTYGLDLIGRNSAWALERGKFPLLIKILDANRPLSVQVHPDDSYALANEGNELGKTEMWVVLDAKPQAEVIFGISQETTPEQFRQAIAAGKLEPYLHRIPVEAGDHINVPAGSLHAIMDGLLIAEIQQNSNTTYRVYDWNRVGTDGQPRPLHIDKALDVINFAQVALTKPEPLRVANEDGFRQTQLNSNPYFTVERLEMGAGRTFEGSRTGDTFEIWGLMDGRGVVETQGQTLTLEAVRFVLLPANIGQYVIRAEQPSTWLRAFV